MTIALDYDGTYTRDPDLWDRFISEARSHGHSVICVTNRPWAPNTTKTERVPSFTVTTGGFEGVDSYDQPIPIICAGDRFKLDAARDAGYTVAIWIDDMPSTISQSVLLP